MKNTTTELGKYLYFVTVDSITNSYVIFVNAKLGNLICTDAEKTNLTSVLTT